MMQPRILPIPTLSGIYLLIVFALFFFGNAEDYLEEVNILADLPLEALLVRKGNLELGNETFSSDVPQAMSLVEPKPKYQQQSNRKTFHEDYHDDEKHLSYKKKKEEIHDILNTSIMTLSYLAFGGYLLCIVVSALREKGRFGATAYPYTNTFNMQSHSQLAHVMQSYLAQRPIRVRFPASTVVNHGRKKRAT